MTSDIKVKKSRIKDVLVYIFSVLLAVAFLYLAFSGIDIKEVAGLLADVSLAWVGAAVLSLLLSHYARALRWQIILKRLKRDTSTANIFGAVILGYGINNVIPRMGEVARAVSAGQMEQVSGSSMLGSIVVERIIDILLFAVAVILCAFLYDGDIYLEFPWLETAVYVGVIFFFFVVITIILTIRYREKFYNIITKLVGYISDKAAEKLAGIFDRMTQGFSSLKGAGNYFYTFLLSIIIMVLYALNSYFFFYALDMQHIFEADFAAAWIVMSIGSIGVMIPTPGGIGSYHTITKSILVVLYGLNAQISIAYATLNHGVIYIAHIIFSVIVFLLLRKKFKSSIFKIKSEKK